MLVPLVVFFCALYALTYSGNPLSGDEQFLFNAIASQTRFADTQLDIAAAYNPPQVFSGGLRLQTVAAEPLQIVLGVPFYWLASHLPGFGLVHTLWMLNVLVGGLAVGVFFLFALALCDDERASLLAAFAFGAATTLWAYSKTFFQEPLLLLFLLLAGLLLERWRVGGWRSWWLVLLALLAFAAGALTKEAAVMALPALIWLALPPLPSGMLRRWLHRGAWLVLLVSLGCMLVLIYAGLQQISTVLPDVHAFLIRNLRTIYNQNTINALHSYLLSPGGSVWGTSPVVVLALPGGWLLLRRGQSRYVWGALLLLAGFALGYALLRGVHWFGGLSWPPRFLLPVVPFLMLVALPVFVTLLRAKPRLWVLPVAVLLLGVWWQVSAVTLDWRVYPDVLRLRGIGSGTAEWSGGLNVLAYLRPIVVTGLWGEYPLDAAWARANLPLVALLLVGLLLACVLVLRWLLGSGASAAQGNTALRRQRGVLVVLPLLLVCVLALGLRALYTDPLFSGDRPELHQLVNALNTELPADSVVLLGNTAYVNFFYNYGVLQTARVIGLPYPPGEQPSPEQAARVRSPNPDALLAQRTPPLLHALAAQHERLWLVEDSGPFLPWSVRPTEWFMALHYYPLRVTEFASTVRLIEYSTVLAPDPFAFRGTEQLTDLQYGDSVHLLGYTLPLGSAYAPGDVLPLSLYWLTDALLPTDYTVAWKLVAEDGFVVAEGQDSYPQGGFMPTTRWLPGVPIWDNRALVIPEGALDGEYRLWVILYDVSTGTLRNLPVRGAEVVAGEYGVLPQRITIQSAP